MIFLEMFVAFAATMAFAVIFNVSRSELIFCGIAGLVAEGVYLFTLRISDETALAIFVASIAVTVLSRILANVRRMPVTVYLISGSHAQIKCGDHFCTDGIFAGYINAGF